MDAKVKKKRKKKKKKGVASLLVGLLRPSFFCLLGGGGDRFVSRRVESVVVFVAGFPCFVTLTSYHDGGLHRVKRSGLLVAACYCCREKENYGVIQSGGGR